MRTRLVFILALALLAIPLCGTAQQIQPVTYVAEFHVKPEKAEQFLDLVKKYDQPVFERMMAEGAVLAWGVDVPYLHEPGGASHSFWWTSPDLSGFDKVFAAFEEVEKKMKEEEAKAAEEARKKRLPAPKSVQEQFLEIIDISKHRDYLFRDLVFGGSSTPPPAGAQPYGWIGLTRVLPGKGDDYRRLWEEFNKPVFDKLVTEGAINGYSLGIEEARSTDAFSHYTFVSLPNLAAREKVREAFRADRQARTAAERSIITNSFLSVLDPAASRTILVRSILFQASPPKP